MRSRGEIYVAGFLTGLSGFVDAVSFLALVQIYTANMSGNSVALGIQLWSQNWPEVARRAWPVFIYVIGLMLGRIWLAVASRLGIRPVVSFVFCFEIVALFPAALAHSVAHQQASSPAEFSLIALLAFVMGLQNATLTHFSSLTLHTGFVTGTLVKMTEQLTKYLTWMYDEVNVRNSGLVLVLRNTGAQENFQKGVLLAAIWAAYVVGAILGAAAEYFFNMRSLFVAITGLAALAMIDMRWPIAKNDEKEQQKVP